MHAKKLINLRRQRRLPPVRFLVGELRGHARAILCRDRKQTEEDERSGVLKGLLDNITGRRVAP